MDGGLQGSHSAFSLHLIGVALEFAILPRGSRRLVGVVEKGGMLCLVQNSEKHIFFPYQEESKEWQETVLRMDREKTNVCENVMRDGSEKFDATGFCSGFSEETGAIQF
jgi:hypothetical protein